MLAALVTPIAAPLASLAALGQTPATPETTSAGLGGGAVPISADVSSVVPTPDVAWRALLPLIILGVGAVLLLTITSLLHKRKLGGGFYAGWTIAVASLSMLAVVPLWARVQGWDHIFWWDLDTGTTGAFSTLGTTCTSVGSSCGAVGIDGFSLTLTLLIGAAVILTALVTSSYLRREGLDGPELYVLLLLSASGGVVMAMANDLIVLFLGLETLSIAVYVLAAMHLKRAQSQEAGMKYFVMGAFSSAFFLYGIAMIYGATGTTNLVTIKDLLATQVFAPIQSPVEQLSSVTLNSPLLLLGLGLLLVGLGFKVAAVPFHFWSPDVYDGSPTPVTGFMASAVKAAGFAALVRVFVLTFGTYVNDWRPIVAVLAALSMIVGSLLAIVQTNVKRTLAYSSINHAGFILMALAASSPEGVTAIVFYLIAYTFMVAGSFAVVTLVARQGDNRTDLDDYKGLSAANPVLALTFTIFLLAQAGVPFTSGFVAKLYTIIASIAAQGTWLAILAMVSSVVAAYLYLRIVVAMYMSGDTEDGTMPAPTKADRIRIPFATGVALAACLVVTIGAGIFPGPVTDFAGESTAVMVKLDESPTALDPLTIGGDPGTQIPVQAGQGATSTGS
jgi:NADH-quinone oxidoreductase subunit N